MEWKDSINAVEIKMAEVPGKCLLRDYNLFLNAFLDKGSHFFSVAIASEDEDKALDYKECPNALAFASIEGYKVTYLIPNEEDLKTGFNSFSLGKATLGNIIQAESSAEPVDDSKYDLTSNSCVHYAGRIWRGLKFDETAELADFLTENLLRDDGFLDIARNKVEQGGFRILSKYAMGEGKFEEFVKNTVLSQLYIKWWECEWGMLTRYRGFLVKSIIICLKCLLLIV